jgi:hypothetical protein
MTILFGNLGDGDTVRAFGTVAAAASLAAIVFGAEAERYAQVHRPALPLTSIPAPKVSGLSQLRLNGVDRDRLSRKVSASLSCSEPVATFRARTDKRPLRKQG